MVRRLLLISVLVVAFMAALAGPASAQYQPGQPGFILDPPQVEPGDSTTVIGNGCPRGSTVTVTIDGQTVGTTIAADDETGGFSVAITAPGTAGDYVVTVTCGTTVMTQILSVFQTTCGFTVTGAPGAVVSASAPGFRLGTAYTLIFQSDPVKVGEGTITADPQTLSFTIPSFAEIGQHTLTVAGTGVNGQPKVLSCPVVVTAAQVQTLPRTGSDSGQLVKAGALLLGAGGLLVLFARRSPHVA